MPDEGQVIEIGVWCLVCGYFEDELEILQQDSCQACGCSSGQHIHAKVVAAGE